MRPQRPLLLAFVLVAFAAPGCHSSATKTTGSTTVPAPEWTYSGGTGPAHWGDLSPDFKLAKTGHAQSPIDIRTAAAQSGDEPSIEVSYARTPLEIMNNRHTVEVVYTAGGTLKDGNEAYTLQQFHFHSPSEHTLDGKHAPLEVHLVHKDAQGDLAVLALMVEEGAANPFLAQLWPHLPAMGKRETVAGKWVDVDELLPASKATWRYTGSLTTPPCSEGVHWFMLKDNVQASNAQLASFRKVYSSNNRPVQPLNGRVVSANP